MGNKHPHKEIQIRSKITKLQGYSDDNTWMIHLSKDNDTFISTVKPLTSSAGIKINIIYEGAPNKISDSLFVTNDSSENPLRPFRWYGSDICVMTTTEEEIQTGRDNLMKNFLLKLDNPEIIWIYEIEI